VKYIPHCTAHSGSDDFNSSRTLCLMFLTRKAASLQGQLASRKHQVHKTQWNLGWLNPGSIVLSTSKMNVLKLKG